MNSEILLGVIIVACIAYYIFKKMKDRPGGGSGAPGDVTKPNKNQL